MVEDDTFTYHVKQLRRDSVNTVVHSLITKERMQKLDLLIHLLSNLTQSLVVCGPEGIGKTMLLSILQERKTELWRYCLIQGSADLSFEAIQNQLAKSISQDKSVQSLSMALGRYEGQHKQVVLIVDDAGELVPGLITAIIQYAAANPVLRVIFALTHDELQVKRGSDRAVDDCHIVEIPTLSEKQCGDFLRYLSAKPAANLSFKAISENMIAQIYRETHGVPGRIITELSGLSDGKQERKLKRILVPVLAVAAACAIAWGVQWLLTSAELASGIALPPALTSMDVGNVARLPEAVTAMPPSKNTDKKVTAPAFVGQKADNIETASPRPESQIILTLPPAQSGTELQEPAMPANEWNEAKDALAPSVKVKTGIAEQQPFTPMTKPEVGGTAVALDLPTHPDPAPFGDKQEKPEPSGLAKTTNDVGSSIAKNSPINAKTEPSDVVGMDQKPGNKQSDVTQANMAERLWAKQEKLKQAELNKKLNSVESITPINPQITPLPQETVEAGDPQQAEPEEVPASSVNNFTLQLMVLSKQSSVNAILEKYPSINSGLRVINTMANGQEKFILEYGSYPDSASANKARKSLPLEFRNALVRKTSSTQHR